jgi:hypothetical protein
LKLVSAFTYLKMQNTGLFPEKINYDGKSYFQLMLNNDRRFAKNSVVDALTSASSNKSGESADDRAGFWQSEQGS